MALFNVFPRRGDWVGYEVSCGRGQEERQVGEKKGQMWSVLRFSTKPHGCIMLTQDNKHVSIWGVPLVLVGAQGFIHPGST